MVCRISTSRVAWFSFLVLISPQRDVGLLVAGTGLWQGPPAVPIQGRFAQGRLVRQAPQVTDGRLSCVLDAPEGKVQVAASQGGVPGPCTIRQDRRHELVALSEPAVVLQELPNATLRFVFHADADGRPRAVVAVLHEAPQDPIVDVPDIRRCPKAVQGRHQDQIGIDLLRLYVDDLCAQGLFHSLSQLGELPRVHSGAGLRSLELVEDHA